MNLLDKIQVNQTLGGEYMKKYLYVTLAAAMIFVLGITPMDVYANTARTRSDMTCQRSAKGLRSKERKLWSDHVLWTRSFIVSDLANLEDKDVVLQRLLKNQEDIGNSIKPYYGKESGNQLTGLLKDHIAIAGKVVGAAKAGNEEELDKNNKLWYKNADDISEFLNSLNPDWSTSVIREMLYRHLQLITDEVTARINKNWQADVAAYDLGEEHMLMFADTLSRGISKQFPSKCTHTMRKH